MRSATEVINLFNLKYNNLISGSAPDINFYEMSLYLTEAKKEIIDMYADNNFRSTFDDTERVRKHISKLILPKSFSGPELKDYSLDFKNYNTYLVNLDDSIWRVKYEAATFKKGECSSNHPPAVIPSNYDSVSNQLKNPFRGPSASRVFRLDSNRNHILISKYKLEEYRITYLEMPRPYILVDLKEFESDFNYGLEQELSIDGITDKTLNELDPFIDDLIINRAVEKAVENYKESSLSNKLSLGSRNL